MPTTVPPPTFDFDATIRDGAVRHALTGYESQVIASLDDLQRQIDDAAYGTVIASNAPNNRVFHGFPTAGVVDGTVRHFHNDSPTMWVLFLGQSAQAPSSSRLITGSSQWQFLGPGGSALLTYRAGTINRWIVDVLSFGLPITQGYVASDYVNWTPGTVETNDFVQRGNVLDYWFRVTGATVPAAVISVQKILPVTFTGRKLQTVGMAHVNQSGVWRLGVGYVNPNDAHLIFYASDLTNWGADAGGTSVTIKASIEVN